MSREVFEQALHFASLVGDDENITLGGGEPLGHPLVFNFLNQIQDREMHATIITSGYYGAKTMRLARMIEDEAADHVYLYISRDEYHPGLSFEVQSLVHRLERRPHAYMALYRNHGRDVIAQGRGANITGAKPGCCCLDVMILPTGNVYQCGCMKTCLGNINDMAQAQLEELAERINTLRNTFDGCENIPYLEMWEVAK